MLRFVSSARHGRLVVLLLAAAVACVLAHPVAAATPRVHAIVGARIVVSPGQVIPHGTIVMRDGLITAVGANVPVPADARVWKGDSLTVYAGLIDPFVLPAEPPAPAGESPFGRRGAAPSAAGAPARGAAHELACVTPETRIVGSLPLPQDQVEGLRAAGFTAAQVAPRRGVFRGQSAVIGLSSGSVNASVLREDAAQVVGIDPVPQGYPGSLMGAIAVIRQGFIDARWYREVQALYARSPNGRPRPADNLAWEALQPVVAQKQPALFVAGDMLEVLRAGAIAREAGITAQVVGGGDEYKRVKEIAAAGLPVIVPVDYPDAPDVSNSDDALEIPIEELRHWDEAPGNAVALARAHVTFALTSNGLKDPKSFRANVAQAIQHGLSPDEALAAVTTVPAKLLGLGDRLGTLAPGRIANLTVTRGDLFGDKSTVREVWVDGDRYETAKDEGGWKGSWSFAMAGRPHTLVVAIGADTSVRIVAGADTMAARNVWVEGDRLRFDLQHGQESAGTADLRYANDAFAGTFAVPGEAAHAVTGTRHVEPAREIRPWKPTPVPAVMGNTEAWRMGIPAQPVAVLVRNATVWTSGPQGTLDHADLLVRAGRIAAVGRHLTAPANAVVVDATGKSVSPGIIDCHNHWAILGNVNECTNSVTAEVRIQDVVNSESINLYRELAGGLTISHLLHGSCNAIGGQCAVIKNRWGAAPDDMLFTAAPPTIKFALGENPKQANWGSEATGRYPQSRPGVEQTIRDAFTRARDYQQSWADWKAGRLPYPPRRDLQLDALSEILQGKRIVHSHSYRQDEILMLMRVADDFGFKMGTFQHVLEGYKVADAMAQHGAGGSTFSDWWAYKQEVIDAIPYNGYLMWDRGVTVSYNSDDPELARRLNTEAAKAVKYGGVPPDEALKFVTINPAKQLHVENRVGSLEPGKDADFVVWSGSPLSPYSHADQTWIDGRKYFDRDADLDGRGALAKERDALIAKARAAKDAGAPAAIGGGRRRFPPRYLDDTDMSGSDEEHGDMPFLGEAARRMLQRGEEVQR
ncbi:MAG TPA: amidohydrolase family protein [Candidatus Eisenbacteria bacterium]|nr:amidohydrolase family protein [Candidatus Eisenbacteria bacterium]